MTIKESVSTVLKRGTPEWWAALPPEKVGNETEKIVESLFKEWNAKASFAWHRMPDAKAGRGRIAAQPGDYIYRSGRNAGFIELKATAHAFRLAQDKVRQLPILRKWALAGDCGIILVHHYMTPAWRVVRPVDLTPGVPSWDLSSFPTFGSAAEAFESTGYF